MDILVALSQSSLERYLLSLRPGGILVYDPKLVTTIPKYKARIFEVPATEKAIELGNRIAANMVILGFLQESTKIISREDLIGIIRETVNKKFIDLNLRAVETGISLAKGVKLEV
jgi:2-oxoglutarate ferredoxin oxidoreductase subunit gamma